MPEVTLIKGDATLAWPLPDNHLASIVTDPPYGIAFMGKGWDDKGGPVAYQVWTTLWAKEAFRCLKPGGFLLAFGATRMAHRMTCGFEDAGFEILDGIEWLYLSGMPKAQDIGKLLDKQNGRGMAERLALAAHIKERREAAGVSREAVNSWFGYADGCQHWERTDHSGNRVPTLADWTVLSARLGLSAEHLPLVERVEAEREVVGKGTRQGSPPQPMWWHTDKGQEWDITTPATDLARQWEGWKTPSLKPAHEPIVVARKPFPGTYCENLEQWGVGAINVDGCRVPYAGDSDKKHSARPGHGHWDGKTTMYTNWKSFVHAEQNSAGRFPANVVLSHGPDCTPEACQDGCPVKVLDAQSGILESGSRKAGVRKGMGYHGAKGDGGPAIDGSGGPASKVFAKFFYDQDDLPPFHYCPKASQRDRNEGCEALPNGNDHATVKPTGLVRYLQRLVTPPGGLTGSPFLGSGTDAVAAIREGFAFWGMNLPDRPGEEYWAIIEARVAHAITAAGEPQKQPPATAEKQKTAPPAGPEQVRFSFESAEGTPSPH